MVTTMDNEYTRHIGALKKWHLRPDHTRLVSFSDAQHLYLWLLAFYGWNGNLKHRTYTWFQRLHSNGWLNNRGCSFFKGLCFLSVNDRLYRWYVWIINACLKVGNMGSRYKNKGIARLLYWLLLCVYVCELSLALYLAIHLSMHCSNSLRRLPR